MKLKEKLAMDSCHANANPHLNECDNYESGFLAGFEAAKQLFRDAQNQSWKGTNSYCGLTFQEIYELGEEEV